MDNDSTQTRSQFISMFDSTQDAIEFEEAQLQAGHEFLPDVAQRVFDGEEPSAAYWTWLASQVEG